MSYKLFWSQGTTKSPIILNSATTDTTSTSLTLYGKGYSNYGEGIQTNLLRILENWASTAAPSNVTRGQLWFDTGTNSLKVYNGSVFQNTTVTTSSTTPLNPYVGELWYNPTAASLYIYDGAQFVSLFSTNPTTGLGAKLDKIGGVMTGPIVLSGGPTLQLHATTKQYVDTVVASMADTNTNLTVSNDVTNLRNLSSADAGNYIRMKSNSPNSVYVPSSISVNFAIGTQIIVRQVGTGITTIVPALGVTILTPSTRILKSQHSTATLVKVETDVWDLRGELL